MPDEAEQAVRRYLNYLIDPSSIVDQGRIQTLEKDLEEVGEDAIKRLHILGALEIAKSSDGLAERAGFVKFAKAYANEHAIPVNAFRSMGAHESVLAEAGFDVGLSKAKGAKVKTLPAGRLRAAKVSKTTIEAHIRSIKGAFTLKQVMDEVGGSIGTVNSVVKSLLDAGELSSLGPVTTHTGRGRAPTQYSN